MKFGSDALKSYETTFIENITLKIQIKGYR